MKIKSDFVTNSSSSSFVVAWPKKITCLEDVEVYIGKEFSGTVYHDAMAQTPVTSTSKAAKQMFSTQISCGYVHEIESSLSNHQRDFCERNDVTQKELFANVVWREQCWDEHTKLTRRAEDTFTEKFFKKIHAKRKRYYLYVFTYSDNEGEYFSRMEHGGIFEKLEHQVISQH